MSSPRIHPKDRALKKMNEKRSSKSVVSTYFDVIYALIMHDIKTRFFGNGLGQILMIIWPFVHIIMLLAIYYFSGRATPFGSSSILYCATGVLPFIIFAYMARWIVYSSVQNRSFRQYPIVTSLDLMIARSLLETLNIIILTILMGVVLFLLGIDFWPINPIDAFSALVASIFLAAGIGIFNGAIAAFFPTWLTVFSLCIIIVYASSGIVFIASSLPLEAREILSYNPVLQTVEWMRAAYYPDYPHLILDKWYTIRFSLIAIGLGLILERLSRKLS